MRKPRAYRKTVPRYDPIMNRRNLLGAVVAAGLVPGALRAAAPLRILILGGTRFTGRHLVALARVRGHSVTLFNRGKSNPDLFPELERLRGDRGSDLAALKGREWDVVIDTSGFLPGQVRRSAGLLASHARQYLFISSISVYARFDRPNDESSALATTDDPAAEKVTDDNYGALKALCEQEVQAAWPNGATIVRPGYIVGPDDYSDRFTYWPVRVGRGGEVLAPGTPADPVQFVDVRDLARFCLDCLERRTRGVFNAVHAPRTVTMGTLLEKCRRVTGSDATFTWIAPAFLDAQHVLEQIPIWSPATGPERAAALVSNTYAARAGLRTTPVGTTIRDTLAWHHGLPAAEQEKLRAGLDPDAERRVLDAWHMR